MTATSVKSPTRKNGSPAASARRLKSEQILGEVQDVLASTQVIDIHTHLFSPAFGKIGLWGIDELLTYHYLESEFFRSSDQTPEEYWKLSKTERADAIWQALFVENSPISESTRGIIAVLNSFGLPTDASGLREARRFFASPSLEAHIREVFRTAGVSSVVMTNDPLDPEERAVWMSGGQNHPQFHAALRLDRILWGWPQHWQQLAREGYAVDERASGKSIDEVRRFLADWHKRMQPLYMAVSLADTFQFPDERSLTSKLLSEAVLPSCRELGLPMSLMIGVRRQVNLRLRLAGDAVGKADMRSNRRGNHQGAHRIARNQLHSSTFRRSRPRAGHLQVAQHAPHSCPHPLECLSIASCRRRRNHPPKGSARCKPPLPHELSEMDRSARRVSPHGQETL